MIIIFHFVYITSKYCINVFKKISLNSLVESHSLDLQDSIDAEENLTFDPPVYKQRYGEIQIILLNNKWKDEIKKIIDFGCAEFKLFQFINRLYRIQEILEIDIDEDLLKENLFRLRPLVADYICKRTEPLNVHILNGSVSDPDVRLLNSDAVIGIELIEHLYPDTLDALPYNIFGFIKPKLVVFTTPNADFNVLFPNFKGFRHYDHKFEWTRQQFEMWAQNIVNRFPHYSVSFKGIGEGPKGTEHLGSCSQMAIFVKDESNYENYNGSSFGVCTYLSKSNSVFHDENKQQNENYKLIESIEYPYNIDERTPKEKIRDELKYRVNLMGNVNGRFYNEHRCRIEIPIIDLIYNQYTHFTTISEAVTILKEAGFQLEECINFDKLEYCVIYEPDMESRSSSPHTSSSNEDVNVDKQYGEWFTNASESSDWEVDPEIQKIPWIIDSSHELQHSEALVNAREIVYNLINNLELDESYDNHKMNGEDGNPNYSSQHPQKVESSLDLQTNTHKAGNISPNTSSFKTTNKDIPGTSAIKKKKKPKRDIEQNSEVIRDVPKLNGEVPQCAEIMHDAFEEVENGDLANNNRDFEGNNYPNAVENNEQIIENDNENVDLQDAYGENERNDDLENRNEIRENGIVQADQLVVDGNEEQIDLELEFSSREVLIDPRSQVDLLDDFDVSGEGEPVNIGYDEIGLENLIIAAIVPIEENDEIGPVMPFNAEPFPIWLLNLLGAAVPEGLETHDEPHFYCQGDGLGVHPSFVEEEFEDESSSTASLDTSSGGTSHDEAEADPSGSEIDVGSLPDDITDSSVEQNSVLQIIPLPPPPQQDEPMKSDQTQEAVLANSTCSSSGTESTDEFFDSIDETSVNSSQKHINGKESENKK